MTPLLVAILFLLLAIATITDIRSHRIYNWTTYTGLFLAFLLRGLEGGSESAQDGVAGAIGCGGVMLVCFLLFDLGGGDLKLLTMIGAFLGWQRGFEVLLWTF
ncbi:MAG: A24 family peptidase, partial [Planctomycetaceae bacterium]|nr:A24 family peptidase [Planctomycetaceae bacterium]